MWWMHSWIIGNSTEQIFWEVRKSEVIVRHLTEHI
jgi:hypothetical protein